MRRIIRSVAIVLILISCSVGMLSGSAGEQMLNRSLPWIVEVTSLDRTFPASISAGYDVLSRTPMAVYYSELTNRLRSSTLVGNGLGDCDQNADWKCSNLLEGAVGVYNDLAYFVSEDGNYFETGMVYSSGISELYFLKSWQNKEGSSGSESYYITSFAPEGSIDSQPSLAYDANGQAHIAVIEHQASGHRLIYITEPPEGGNNNPAGDTLFWPTYTILSGDSADTPSISIDKAGKPIIAYYDLSDSALGYAYQTSQLNNCSATGWRCITIDSILDTGKHPAIAAEATPYISYYNSDTGALRVAKFVGSGGNCGSDWTGIGYDFRWRCQTIEEVGAGIDEMAISMVMDGEYPIIAYKDINDDDYKHLKLAQPSARSGMVIGNCGLGNEWYCETIDKQWEDVGRDIDMAISPSGSLFIAFSYEWQPDEFYLLVARQYFEGFLPLVRR